MKRIRQIVAIAVIQVMLLLLACTPKAAPAPVPQAAAPAPAPVQPPSPATALTPATSPHDKWLKEFQEWEKTTYEAASKEGRVVWYTADTKEATDALARAFATTYPGLKLETGFGRGGELAARVTTEQDARQVVVDVFSTALSVLRPMATQNRNDEFIPPATKEPGVSWTVDPLIERGNFPDKPFPILYGFTAHGLIFNTKLVPPDKEPKSWKDLVDPWWKGKIMIQDPRISGGGNQAWYWMRKLYGEEFWQKLAGQNLAIERSYEVAARAVATGEYYLALGGYATLLVPIKGAPVKYLVPTEGAQLTQNSTILVKGAPHPNGAKLFMNLLLTKTGQDIIGGTGTRTPVRADAKLLLPEQSLAGLKLLIGTMEEDLGPLRQAQEDVKKYLGK